MKASKKSLTRLNTWVTNDLKTQQPNPHLSNRRRQDKDRDTPRKRDGVADARADG